LAASIDEIESTIDPRSSAMDIDSPPPPPWFRLHWASIIFGQLVLGGLIYRQLVEELLYGIGDLGVLSKLSVLGWPFWHCVKREMWAAISATPTHTVSYEWMPWAVAGNIAISVLILVCAVGVLESWLRSPRPWQFGIRAILIAMTVVGLLILATREEEFIYVFDESPLEHSWSVIGWADLTDPFRWSFLVAVACAVYGLVCLPVAIVERFFRQNEPPEVSG
jgi:hypothetical protein